MNTEKPTCKKYLVSSLLILVLVFSAACGTNIVRGESPMVRMTELSHQDNNISLQVSMRNPNDVDLDILSIDIRLTVNQNEDSLFVYTGPVDTNIVANGTESWSMQVEESQASRELLDSLEKGEIKSLPYAMKGTVTIKHDSKLQNEYQLNINPLQRKNSNNR